MKPLTKSDYLKKKEKTIVKSITDALKEFFEKTRIVVKEYWAKSSKNKRIVTVSVIAFLSLLLINGVAVAFNENPKEIASVSSTEKKDNAEKAKKEEKRQSDNERKEKERVEKEYSELSTSINSVICLPNANEQEQQIFNTRKDEALASISNKAPISEIKQLKATLIQTNADIRTRLNNERVAAEEAARIQAEQQRVQAEQAEQQRVQAAQQASQAQQNEDVSNRLCVDGTLAPVGSNPSARGRANACYGHGGFQINH